MYHHILSLSKTQLQNLTCPAMLLLLSVLKQKVSTGLPFPLAASQSPVTKLRMFSSSYPRKGYRGERGCAGIGFSFAAYKVPSQQWDDSFPVTCRMTFFQSRRFRIPSGAPTPAAPTLIVPGQRGCDSYLGAVSAHKAHHTMAVCTCKTRKFTFSSSKPPKMQMRVQNVTALK